MDVNFTKLAGVLTGFSTNLQKGERVLIDAFDIPEDMVFVGASVRLREIDTGDEDLYKIVGTATNDFSLDYVEVTSPSPLGEALMKARVGDVIQVDLPKGRTQFEILELI